MQLEGLGYTALWPGIGMFPDWVRQKEFGIQNRGGRGRERRRPLERYV